MNNKPRDVKYCGVNQERIKAAKVKINPQNFAYLTHFMEERFKIHLKKDVEKLPRPWTEDKILQTFKFTNVFREDDYVTKKLIETTQKPIRSLQEQVLNTVLYRAWNNPKTFEDFGGPWTVEEIYDGKALKEKVRPIYHKLKEAEPHRLWFSSAYNQGGTKLAAQCENLDGTGEFEKDIPLRIFHLGAWMGQLGTYQKLINAPNQLEAFKAIREIRGFADFLAYQIFVDLTYIPEFPFSENEFVIAGPGCRWGLDYIFDDADGLSYSEQIFKLKDILEQEAPQLNELYVPNGRKINVMNVENCMCEISKYIRAATGTGRPRNHYKPREV